MINQQRAARGLLDWFDFDETDTLPAIFGHAQSQEQPTNSLLASHYDEFTPEKPLPQFRLWPEQDPLEWWDQHRNDQLYRNWKREEIPPNFRPPLDAPVPGRRNLISGR